MDKEVLRNAILAHYKLFNWSQVEKDLGLPRNYIVQFSRSTSTANYCSEKQMQKREKLFLFAKRYNLIKQEEGE